MLDLQPVKRIDMSSAKQQRTSALTSTSRLLSPPTRLTGRPSTPEGVPLWFHGLLARSVAEDLLLKNPQSAEGLFLVRQSSNRGGHFVISVCTGQTVNHYLVETLESMFYVRRDRSQERGRDIQARDLCSLVQCYRSTPLDESGLFLRDGLLRTIPVTVTAPLTAMTRSRTNHNYIPLHVDNREYVALEDFTAGEDLQALSFRKGELLTVLQRESRSWWFAYDARQDLGYVPAALVCSLKEWQQKARCLPGGAFRNLACSEADAHLGDAPVVEREARRPEEGRQRRLSLLDVNSNVLSVCAGSVPASPTHSGNSSGAAPPEPSARGKETVCVSADYIALCLRHREHQKLCQMQRVFDARLSQRPPSSGSACTPEASPRRPATPNYGPPATVPPDCRRDLKPRILLRSQTEPAGVHSAPPSPHRRPEPLAASGRSSCNSLATRENVPCLTVSAVAANDLPAADSPERTRSPAVTSSADSRPARNDRVTSDVTPSPSREPASDPSHKSNCSSPPTNGRLVPSDTATIGKRETNKPSSDSPSHQEIISKYDSYDPIATYLRLSECTTGPRLSIN